MQSVLSSIDSIDVNETAASGSLPRRSARLVRDWLGGVLRGPLRRENIDHGELRPSGVSRRSVEKLVGMPVGDLDLYEHALRHRSLFRGMTTTGTESNERLEFLGDAVLGTIVAERLYGAFPDCDEGLLTRTRANLVNGKTLATFAESLGLGELVLMSENMVQSDGRHNATILADAFEAIIGALYLDLGFSASRRFVNGVLDRFVSLEEAAADRSNYKSLLLEYVQARSLSQPVYEVVAEEGPSHDRRFTVEAIVDDVAYGTGSAGSKKEAEQKAACRALEALRAVAA